MCADQCCSAAYKWVYPLICCEYTYFQIPSDVHHSQWCVSVQQASSSTGWDVRLHIMQSHWRAFSFTYFGLSLPDKSTCSALAVAPVNAVSFSLLVSHLTEFSQPNS